MCARFLRICSGRDPDTTGLDKADHHDDRRKNFLKLVGRERKQEIEQKPAEKNKEPACVAFTLEGLLSFQRGCSKLDLVNKTPNRRDTMLRARPNYNNRNRRLAAKQYDRVKQLVLQQLNDFVCLGFD